MGPYPQHKNNFTADTTAGVSGIWADCPYDEVVSGYHPGYARQWDFADIPTNSSFTTEALIGDGVMLFGSTGAVLTAGSNPTVGTATVAANAFGTATMGSNDDNEGAAFRHASAPLRISGPNATATARTGKLWFEARVKQSVNTVTLFDWFVGLMEDTACTAAVPVTATAGQLADKNLLGFFKLGSAPTFFDAVYKSDGQPSSSTHTTALASAQAIVADTYVKLGLTYDPNSNRVIWWGNGVQLASYVVLATQGNPFPNDVNLGWVIGNTNVAGSITATWTVDWVRCCQIPLAI